MIQLYADGFASLPLKEKTLIWHLYQAALAGRDIFIDQKHRNALEMRALIEAVVAHPQGVDPATLAQVQRYTKLFWINNGPYNNLTAQKFVMQTAARGVCHRREGGGDERRRRDAAGRRIARRDADAAATRCSSTPPSIPS